MWLNALKGLDDLTGRRTRISEVVTNPVDLPPGVHRVDHELAAQRVGRDGAVLAEWERQDDDVSLRGSSAAVVATAPGVTISTISAIFDTSPEPAISTRYPAATARRASTVPTLPAPGWRWWVS
jgi:hypothetical protein